MRSRAKASSLLLVSVLLVALCSCMEDTKSLTFVSIGEKGWARTDTLNYAIPPLKGVEDCSISLLLHTEGYGYENIALDIDIRQDSTQLYHRQHHYWLNEAPSSRGIARRCDYILPAGNYALCDTLPTIITLVHRTDPSTLMGIREIGIRISEPVRQADEPVWRVDWH